MIINFDELEETVVQAFKGGTGEMRRRMVDDGHNKIMLNRLQPGATAGMHAHDDSSEIIYVLRGELGIVEDGVRVRCPTGALHYCPKGHSHAFGNPGKEEAVFLAIVPTQP